MTLVAHYPFDEDSGSTANDVTGNGNDGTINGATLSTTGILGTDCYTFDGSDDWVDLGEPSDLSASNLGDAFSVCTWIKFSSEHSPRFLGKMSSSNNDSYHLSISGGSGNFQFYVDDGSNHDVEAIDPNTGQWYHVVGTHDGNTIRLYVDSEEAGSTSGVGSLASAGGSPVSLGSHGGDGNFLDGQMDDVRFYDHTLTPQEIQYIYNTTISPEIFTTTKRHSSSVQPNITNASFTLNGESATIYVVGSPGTSSQETQSADLSSGTSEYSLSWSNSHSEFRIAVRGDISDPKNRVEVSKIGLGT